MTKENIPELLKKAINCWESLREPIADYGIVDPKRMIPHLVIDAFLSGYRDGAMAGHDQKIQVTRIYGARGEDVFAEGVLSTKVNSNGSHAQMENQGRLNPAFSRWLMGFPKAWCEAAIEAWHQMPINRRKRAPCD